MKNFSLRKLTFALLIGASVIACEKDNDDTDEVVSKDFTEILTTFTDKTVVPTLGALRTESEDLLTKVKTFNTTSTTENLAAAAEAWKLARKHWERSEAFLFGPADVRSLDPKLDSWPLDRSQLETLLSGTQELNAEFVSTGCGEVLKGFHAIEFMIFREGQPRDIADITAKEKEYLAGVTETLRNDCLELWARWTGGDATSKALLEELEIEIDSPYAPKFKNSGKLGGTHVSHSAAVDQIIQGMVAIADEVGKVKINDPVTANDPLKVESWFSYNSREDFMDNIKSIENCYLGGTSDANRGGAISNHIKSIDPELDTKVKKEIADCIAAIEAIPHPFRDNLTNNQCKVAMAACLQLQGTLESLIAKFVE